MTASAKYKVAYLVSHPIQYQAPMLRYLAAHSDIELTAFFLSDFSVRGYQDAGFGAAVSWDVPLLEGYQHEFLPSLGSRDKVTALRPFSTGLLRALKAGKFDALWMHGYAHPVNLRAMAIAKALGIKVFVRAESQLISALRPRGMGAVKEAVIRKLFQSVDAFLNIGHVNSEYYRHYGVPASKIFPVPYAVDNAFFQERALAAHPHREELRTELGLESDRPVILFASKFIKRKRAIDLLEAYIGLSPDGKTEPPPYLLFAGDGEERPALEARARETGWSSIRFLGFKNQTELPALYDLCDVFVLASAREPWGLIVNEVMNTARPVIVSDEVGSAPDLVRDGVNGFIVPVGDVPALTGRLREVVSSKARAQSMGEASLARINQWGFAEDLQGLQAALHATVGSRT